MAPAMGLALAASAFAAAAIVDWQPRPGAYWWVAAAAAVASVHVATAARDQSAATTQLEDVRAELRGGTAPDGLTGLPGRGRLLIALRSDDALDEVAALELTRLDRLRDTWGPEHADALEVEVAERLVAEAGPAAVVVRQAPGRFAVAHSRADEDHGEAWACGVQRAANRPVRLGVIDATPGVRLGVAAVADLTAAPDSATPEELLSAAQLALHATGAEATVTRYEAGLRAAADRRVELAGELQAAGASGELEVYFQPITRLADGRIVGAEALLRWHHPRNGTVDASEWVRVAEEIGLLPQVGRATLGESCRHFAALAARRAADPLTVSVNLAPAELATAGIVDHVRSCLSSTGLAPELLVIEVDPDGLAAGIDTVAELRQLGVRIAVDDVGSGAVSLRDLRRVELDQLKVDADLVAGLTAEPAVPGLVDAVARVGRALGAEVVAEGVSTEAQAEALRDMGVDLAQGYLYGRALPFTRFVAAVDRIDAALDGSDRAVAAGPAHEAADSLAELG